MTQINLKLNFNELKELLVDDNNKVNLEIGTSIVQEFTRRYLKGIANEIINPMINSFKEEITEQILREFSEYFCKQEWRNKITLKDKFSSAIKESVHNLIQIETKSAIREELKKVDLSQAIQSVIKSHLEMIAENEIIKVKGIIGKEVAKNVINQLQAENE